MGRTDHYIGAEQISYPATGHQVLRLVALLALGACGFQGHALEGPGDDDEPVDGEPPDISVAAPSGVAHVGADDAYVGTGDLEILASLTINTTTLALGMALPDGVTFAVAAQAGGGPELAILHVRHFESAANLRVVGTRPLVVIADAVDFSGAIDATAHHDEAGPGAPTSGGGGTGAHAAFGDSGGGGGGGGTAGAPGGSTACGACLNNRIDGGSAGTASGTAALVGGAPGGRSYLAPGSPCTGAPGAGGGAIEIYARTRIATSGNINVGGGGGRGGDRCQAPDNWLAGHGGGAGGMIVLQSPVITNTGRLSANGGGGGAGAGEDGDGNDGEDGKDAQDPATVTAAARGGTPRGPYSAAGGNGAIATAAAQPGGGAGEAGNGGGGGGGAGRIVLRYRTSVAIGTASPAAVTETY